MEDNQKTKQYIIKNIPPDTWWLISKVSVLDTPTLSSKDWAAVNLLFAWGIGLSDSIISRSLKAALGALCANTSLVNSSTSFFKAFKTW